jgi:hypothetical protein
MATKKIKRFQEGGMSDKDRGLEASKDEKVGFFERLRMGNIDDEGSEAYRRFGAGRGKAERTPMEDRVATSAARSMAAAPEMDEMEAANAREPIPVPAGPKVEQRKSIDKPRVNTQATKSSAPVKSSPKMQEQSYRRTGGPTAEELAKYKAPAKNPNYSNEGRGRELTKKQQIEQEIDSIKPSAEQTQKGLESASLPGAGLKALSMAAKKLAARSSKKLQDYDQPALPVPKREALPPPTKRLEYDKAGTLARKRSERADVRREEMLKENARRYGLDEDAPGYEAAAAAVRKGLGGKDFGLKKGGSVKQSSPTKKMASGGMVSSASKRADGIATKGKTRCKMR